jgi:hypothetical protein
MTFSTVMAKGVVAKMAAGYRATALPDGECGDCLTYTEDHSQSQNRGECLATHLKAFQLGIGFCSLFKQLVM